MRLNESALWKSPLSKPPVYDSNSVRALFDEMAATYGTVNLITSFGFAARWRHQAVRHLPARAPLRILDLMSGMCELSASLARYWPTLTHVAAVDLSPEMTRRARKDFPFNVTIHLQDVLDFTCAPADAIVSSFGLKTFDRAQQAQLALRVAMFLKPGGAFSFVEISVPRNALLRIPYMFYLKRVIPALGRLFLGNPENYRMLGVYTESFGDCSHFQKCLESAGLRVTRMNYFFGCASGVCGTKPS